MGDNSLVNYLKDDLIKAFSMLDEIFDKYPYHEPREVNSYLEELIYRFEITCVLFDDKNNFSESFFNIITITKENLKKCLKITEDIIHNWLFRKNDEWLKLPYIYNNTILKKIYFNHSTINELPVVTNFEQILSTINCFHRSIGNLEKMIKGIFTEI